MLTGKDKYLLNLLLKSFKFFKYFLFLFLLVYYTYKTYINDNYLTFINQQLYDLYQAIKVLSCHRCFENVTYNKFDIYFLGKNIECLLYNTCKITQIKDWS